MGSPEYIWAVQLAGLLTGIAVAAYASLGPDSYKEVKLAVLHL